jgi:hypothetical protein
MCMSPLQKVFRFLQQWELVSDRRWFWPNVLAKYLAEYSAKTEYSVPPQKPKVKIVPF